LSTLPLIFLGAAFCFAWAGALGQLSLRRLPVPWEVKLAIGAAAESLLVFILLAAGWASLWTFLALGALSLALACRFPQRVPQAPSANPEPAARAQAPSTSPSPQREPQAPSTSPSPQREPQAPSTSLSPQREPQAPSTSLSPKREPQASSTSPSPKREPEAPSARAAARSASPSLHGADLKDPPSEPAPRSARFAFAAILAVYGIFYFVHALAPEIQSDATSYHLGFASEYARTGRFPLRVGFFEMVPQGLEMLFTVAFSIGRHSAAKLVHFGFLLATIPLLLRIGRRLRLNSTAALAAAGIYFCAPVTGISGTCSYNDAALVFYILVAFYLLLVWAQQQDDRYLLPAGIAAGFCCAIKFTGIIVLPILLAAVLIAARRLRPALFASAGVILIAPWMIRDALLSGNPLAPLFNRWFPNPYFHASMETFLSQTLRSYGGYGLRNAPVELAIGGHLQGLFGPLLFAMPLGLLALRRRQGRWCWLAAVLLAVPWLWNIGGRFFMPSFVFLALALVMALPRPAALACLLFQAVTCWPQVIPLYQPVDTWNLEDFPWRAALRLEPEPHYLARTIDEYRIARMIDADTKPGERVFSLEQVASAYTDRESLDYWHSAQGDHLLDTLRVAGQFANAPLYDVKAAWPPQLLRGMRFRLAVAHPGEWCIHEIQLYSGDDRIYDSPQWLLSAWPNVWELPAAFDRNLATRYRTWTPMRPGMFAEVDFDRGQFLSSATLVSHTPVYGVPIEFYGLDAGGRWLTLGVGNPVRRAPEDLRRQATNGIKRAGFDYILAPTGNEGTGPFARVFLGHEAEWGLEDLGEIGDTHLYRIR
jgi:hypothetical protein